MAAAYIVNPVSCSIILENKYCQIGSKSVSVRILLKRLASTPFDSEGVRTQDLEIIQDGVLQTYLLTSYSGRKMGMQSTGHAGGIHNWLVKPNLTGGLTRTFTSNGHWFIGYRCHGARRKYCDRGLFSWRSRFLGGKWRDQYPVAEITIAGQLQDMLKNIVAVADDVEHRSNIQTGSILLDKMKISGELINFYKNDNNSY